MNAEAFKKSAEIVASAALALTAASSAAAQAKGDKEAHSSAHCIDAREPAASAAPAHFIDARSSAIVGSAGAKTWIIDTSKPIGTVVMLM